MEGYCSTGQSPQQAVVPMEEEKTQSVPRCKHSASVIKTDKLKLCSEIIAVYEIHTNTKMNCG
jgi:hypothetical protein